MNRKVKKIIQEAPLWESPPQVMMPKGTGYYDVSVYPYGGDFKRVLEDTLVTIGKPAGRYPYKERETIINGKKAVISLDVCKWDK